jgi:SagB-type dehydrogenase family enzyme
MPYNAVVKDKIKDINNQFNLMEVAMKRSRFLSIAFRIVILFSIVAILCQAEMGVSSTRVQEQKSATSIIDLPRPVIDGSISIEKALSERRTVRSYSDKPLSLADISQLLWAAQGITEPKRGLRTAPSAQASYLMKVYLITGKAGDLTMGIYQYQPKGHKLVKIADGDIKTNLYDAAPQNPIKNAPAAIVITGLSSKAKNPSWIYIEAGHIAQNICLQAVSLNIGTVTMAGFKPEEVKKALKLNDNEQPVYIMPIGKK